jgi:phosphinothricin acetyltransferase
MALIIRNATIDDVPSILAIVNHAILFSTANYNYEIQTLTNQMQWFQDKKKANFPILVAEFDSEVIGFGTYGTFREKIGYQFKVEHSIYVSESHIGKGVGKLVLSHLISTAKTDGYHVMIGAVDAENKDSIAFHEKFGFTVSGTISEVGFKFDRWLDLVLMQLILK